jgi:hypothetical protein
MIRDEEIKRLIKYAQALGMKVTFNNKRKPSEAAAWVTDGSEIIIYKSKNTSKIETILSLVHELGHAASHVHDNDRKINLKVDHALENPDRKRSKKIIWEDELEGSKWWESIYKEVNLKFPKWRLYAQMEFDVWQYQMDYENDKFPTNKEKKQKWAELKTKYKENQNG